jgi:hypothetical protein
MYYTRHSNLADMGVLPIAAIIGGAATIVGATVGVGGKLWGESAAEEAAKKQLRAAQLAAKRAQEAAGREAIRQAEEIARQEAAGQQQAIISEANARRNYTMVALYAIGGVAVVASLFFLYSGMTRKKTP